MNINIDKSNQIKNQSFKNQMGGLGVRNHGVSAETEAAELANATSPNVISVSSGIQRPFSVRDSK